MKRIFYISLIVLLTHSPSLFAQACCTAGTPLLSSLELPATQKGSWQFAVTADYNYINTNIENSTTYNYPTKRKRYTAAGLLEVSYGISNKFSVSALSSFVKNYREVTDAISTRGLGDLVLLLKYNFIPLNISSQRSLAFGIGPKIPLGKAKLKSNGVFLNEDIQPGSGTWDVVFWAYGYQGFLPTTRLNLLINTTYRIASENWRGFRFGNELSLTVGTSYRTDTPFDYSLQLRIRNTSSFTINGSAVSNTGGNWVSLVPGINFKFNEDIAFRASGLLPVYRNLNGVQLTTTYKINFTMFYTIQPKSLLGL